jgi:hypothetical protein
MADGFHADFSASPRTPTMAERNVILLIHRYCVEQAVEFFPASGIDRKAKGQYTVVRLLPIEGAIPQYRLKNQIDGHERVVCENELRSLDQPWHVPGVGTSI